MVKENEYVQYLEKVYPNLDVQTAYVNDIGQNNDVLIVNENIVFRFPKYEEGITKLIAETKLLEKIQNYASLSIPCPSYQHFLVIIKLMESHFGIQHFFNCPKKNKVQAQRN